MGRISRLPEDLANQIAAGEVVERPASVVKELIENAIDAKATRIVVTAEYGGKKLVRVEDDGIGMDPDDARLCLERHATSKIRRADDLGAIVTLGFRGEALPSIASVSHFRLRSRARGSESGTEIRVNAGIIESVVEAGGPEGTMVEVADVFYNLPARRKFLKSDAAEAAQLSRFVTQLALCYPEVGFTLTSSGRKVITVAPVTNLSDRLYQLYGDRQDLIPVDREFGGVRLHGFIAALAEQGPVRGPQHVFVNRRIVKDRTIAHAILDAYSVATNKERSPEVHLFLDVPPDRVDVNVHPTKAEVRFKEQSQVHQIVRHALGDALGKGPAPELTLRTSDVMPGRPMQPSIPGALHGGSFPSRWAPPTPGGFSSVAGGLKSSPTVETTTANVGANFGSPAAQAPSVRPMIALGQFRDTFIIAMDDEGLCIIDQHVAHERVLFERIMERLTNDSLESQRLLIPAVLELPAAERAALVSKSEALAKFGFEVEEFGGDTIRVTAVPALLDPNECDTALRALAEDLEGLDRGLRLEDALKQIAATTACHAAVKAHYPLTLEKMHHILEELRATAYSTVCPHGRPVMLRITRR
ncbi:MAG TPA: DNA mismatch repair endonuclease MutL, partial [Vicinamibacterales bacterium]|nr:DNA mismatch repair endonuclease MutL [Vicinamibacterales bacterium]